MLALIRDSFFECGAGPLSFVRTRSQSYSALRGLVSTIPHKIGRFTETMRVHPSKRHKQGRKTPLISGYSSHEHESHSTRSDDDSGKFCVFPRIVEHILVDTPTVIWSELAVVPGVYHSCSMVFLPRFCDCSVEVVLIVLKL